MDKYVFFDIDGTLNETERTFEGIPEALAELKERGYKLVICSNTYPEHIEKVLDVLGIRRASISWRRIS